MKSYGIDLNEQKNELIARYLSLLISAPVNVSGIEDFESAVHKHVVDVLLPIESLEGKLLDVGTGGGVPGVVLSIVYPVASVLVDSSKKKTVWLSNTIEKLGLKNVEVVCERIENLADRYRESFDYVTARAVASLRVLLELCAPFCRVNGLLLLYKGPNWPEEMTQARRAAEILKVQLEESVEYKLSGGERRALLKFRKFAPTEKTYPRDTKKIMKRPL
ncbi:MAG: rRNA (guanine527-N7)-methyltransferase [Pseudothermotoga sp.]|nr:rRNA (guanine527-N7)-methyltransferase [Pseudothermotoga sp.]